MAQKYIRQSTFTDGDTITASLFNDEYNQLENAFEYSSTSEANTGHRHDGSEGQGGNIFKIGDLDFLNKIEVDSTNNRLGFYVEVSSAAVEQLRIQDGSVVPVTTNDVDLGTSSLQFKDLYLDGTANIDSLTLTSGATVTTILDEDDMSSNSATALATQQSIKAYVDAQDTAQDLDFQGDTGGALSIDLDSETFTVAGGTGIDTAGSANTLTVNIDSTVATLTGTQTLTNKTLTSPDINGGTIDNAVIGGTTAAAGSFTTVSTTGDITVGGNVDGRDVAADGTKLDGIESGATADQTAAEIRQLVESATDSNVFTDADHTKLDGIEANATADQTAGEIRALVESATDSNVFTDADHSKLDGIEAGADVTDATNVQAAGALMDSEVTNLAQVKAFDSGDYATAAQGTLASSALQDVVDDLTPQLGGHLDVNGKSIVSVTNGNIDIAPNGTGKVILDGLSFPTSDGTSGQTIVTDGAGNLSFASAGTGTLSNIVQDTTPQLGGNLDLNGNNIVSSGSERIGIGTTSPLHEIHINAASPQIRLTESDLTNVVADIQMNGGALSIDSRSGADNGVIRFRGLGDNVITEYARFTSAGRFGIGVTNPSEELDVQAATDPSIRVRSTGTASTDDAFMRIEVGGTTASSYLMFGDATNSGTGRIRYVHSDDSMRIYAGEVTERIRMYSASIQFRDNTGEFGRFDSNGRLGLGTTSPSSKLHVQDTSAIVRSEGTGGYGAFYAIGSGTFSSHIFMGNGGGEKGRITTNDSGAIIFSNTTSITERMRISAAGNVGIGTLTPSYDLSVVGSSAAIQVDNTAGSPDQTLMIFQADMGTNDRNFQIKSPSTDSASAPFRFVTGNSFAFEIDTTTDALVIDSSANVGIGESAPDEALVVRGGNYSSNQNGGIAIQAGDASGSHLKAAFKLKSDGSGVFRTAIDATSGIAGGTIEAISIANNTGRVGIGTTSPSNNLDVSSSGNTGIRISSTFSGSTTTGLFIDTVGDTSAARLNFSKSDTTRGIIGYSHNATANSEAITFGTAGGTERMRINATGVGIHNSSPSYPLDVVGSARVSSGLLFGSTTSYLYEGAANQVNIRIGADGPYVEFVDAGSGVAEFGNAGGQLALTSAGAERVRIDNSGNVGIGNTIPTSKLHIGDISAANATYPGQLNLENSSASLAATGGLEFTSSAYQNGYGWKINAIDIGGGVELAIGTRQNAATWSEKIRVDSAGHVGIGTTDPSQNLQIHDASAAIIRLVDDAGTNQYADIVGNGGNLDFRARNDATNGSFIFYGAGGGSVSEYARWDANKRLRLKGALISTAITVTGSGTKTLSLVNDYFVHTLTGNTTYVFANALSSGNVNSFVIKITQDSTARTVTWPASVDWAGGTAPTLSTGSGEVDVFVFFTNDGGTTYYGFVAGQDLA